MLTLSGLTVALFLSGCATETNAPAAPAAPAPAAAAAPAAPAAPAPRKVTFTADVSFPVGAVLSKAEKANLDETIARLGKLTKVEVIVATGHTDNRGTKAAKEKLGQARANAVKAYMVSKGVAANLIYAESKGDTVPVAYNTSAQGRARNSRVEVEVIGFKAQ